jgi:hypothetical protein
VPRVWGFLWTAVALAYVVLALLYLVALALKNLGDAVAYAIAISLELAVLFLAEGVEISVTMLLDKDAEQIPIQCRESFQQLVESRDFHNRAPEKLFMSGRQLLVTIAAVALTFTCEGLSKHWTPEHAPWIVDVFKFGFPVIIILWFAQLLPKYLARANPVTTYAWYFSRALIRTSIGIEKMLYIGAPSDLMLQKISRFIKGIGNELRPSRESYYRTSATLRDGKALEKRQVDILIEDDGSIHVTETFYFKSYAVGFRQVGHKARWEAKIIPCSMKLVEQSSGLPDITSLPDPKLAGPEQVGDLSLYSAEWDCTFRKDIPIGMSFAFEIKYKTEKAATRVPTSSDQIEKDFYGYNVTQIATKLLEVSVRPAAHANITLVDGWAEVKGSKDEVGSDAINVAEGKRVIVEYTDRYRYRVWYPLPSTAFRFYWKLRVRKPPVL